MRVAIDAVGIRSSGGAALLLDFLQWLPVARPGWTFTVYLLPPAARQFADPAAHPRRTIEYVPLGDTWFGRIVWLTRALPLRLNSAGCDVLFALANIGALRTNVPTVIYLHQALAFPDRSRKTGPPGQRLRLLLMRSLILKSARKSAAFIVQTEEMRRRLGGYAPFLTDRIHVIPGCVSEAGSAHTIRPEKQSLIDTAGEPRLLYVAGATVQKNHAGLIRALPLIAARFPGASLLLTLEDGPSAGKEYVASLRKLSKELQVERYIVLLGSLRSSEVRHALRCSSLAVFSSVEESFGLPLAEAIVEGCPLAASDLGYARDVAGDAAIYFDPFDPVSIASVVITALERPEIRAGIREEQGRRAAHFDPRNVAYAIAGCLEIAVAGS
jgi:glycosyltransferase involved in cell wall biosynthesis